MTKGRSPYRVTPEMRKKINESNETRARLAKEFKQLEGKDAIRLAYPRNVTPEIKMQMKDRNRKKKTK